jgi:hypothetical protein
LIVTQIGGTSMRQSRSNRSQPLPDIDPSVALAQTMGSEHKHRALFWTKRAMDRLANGTHSRRAGSAAAGRRNRILMVLLTVLVLLPGTAGAASRGEACRPLLSTKAVREVRPVTPRPLPWRWHATILADVSFCATRSGSFEVDFIRTKENAPDLQFTQKFRWTQDQFEVSTELSGDEAIVDFRIGFIAPCVCREVGELSDGPRMK